MSEPRDTVSLETNEIVDDEVEAQEVEELEDDDEGDDEGDKPSAKVAADWESKFHDKEGQAARERSRRRAAERQVAELNERLDKLEARTGSSPSKRAALIAKLRADSEEPLSDIDALKEVARTLLEEEAQETARAQETAQRERYFSTLTNSMKEFEADFRLDHKDYDKACEFFKKTRAEELEDLGYSGDRLTQRMAQELYSMVDESVRAGRDPAETAYNMAKRRGFTPTADDATKKLQKLQNGARSGVTANAGSTGAGRVTYEQVTRAKGAERDKLWSRLRKQEMGGPK